MPPQLTSSSREIRRASSRNSCLCIWQGDPETRRICGIRSKTPSSGDTPDLTRQGSDYRRRLPKARRRRGLLVDRGQSYIWREWVSALSGMPVRKLSLTASAGPKERQVLPSQLGERWYGRYQISVTKAVRHKIIIFSSFCPVTTHNAIFQLSDSVRNHGSVNETHLHIWGSINPKNISSPIYRLSIYLLSSLESCLYIASIGLSRAPRESLCTGIYKSVYTLRNEICFSAV